VIPARLSNPEKLARRVRERETVLCGFLEAEQDRIARICFDMARAFNRGGSLIAYGTGPAATDAAHIAVEFMHPVIVGKRALPAVALSNDPSGAGRVSYAPRPGDIALGLTHYSGDLEIERWLGQAAALGALTIGCGALAAEDESALASAVDHALVVPSGDPFVVQEVQETAYHILWELVHVFFEHPGLLDDACITCGDVAVPGRVVALSGAGATIEKDGARERVSVELVEGISVGDMLLCHAGVALQKLREEDHPTASGTKPPSEPTNFLYPFLDSEETDLERVMADVRASTLRKGGDVSALRRAIDVDAVRECAAAVRERLNRGGRLITFGNGGSSTDAQDLAADALGQGWPAIALTNDPATVTAVGNDVGFEKVFSRQLIPLARDVDVAVAISTSGSSPNIIAGLQEACGRQMLTCAITGYDGGRLAELDWLDHLLVVHGDYIPRLQEAHATIYHLLLEAMADHEP
jgi:D-sedoheptulose 7-phosphate isomerase